MLVQQQQLTRKNAPPESSLKKTGCEADVAWFLAADFKHYRQLQAFGYVLCFFAVNQCGMLRWYVV